MSVRLDNETFEVIGSTITFAPDNLPRRLRPIYRRTANDEVWFTAVTRQREESTELAALEPVEAKALADDGEILLLEKPIAARVGHLLLQISHDEAPEYLPTLDVPHRLRQAENNALDQAAKAFAKLDEGTTLQWVWYARRASLDDPLPLLLLLKLLERAKESPADLAVLNAELSRFDGPSREAAQERLRTAAMLAPFASFYRKPAYLPERSRGPSGAGRWSRGHSSRTT